MVILTKLITPDGTELISRHRHDFITHTDKNGKLYMIDGGRDYIRRSANGDEKLITITTNSPFEEIRDNFSRYNRFLKTYIKLKYISDEWLQNILDWYKNDHGDTWYFRLYLEEKLYRAENEIYVSEQLSLEYA